MKRSPRIVQTIYVTNLSLLATHQVDAAFWHEWEVFGVPGGLTFFLVFNIAAVFALAMGLVLVAKDDPKSRLCEHACAGVGAFTACIHAIFLYFDRHAFWSASSLLILAAIACASVAQVSIARAKA
jgi:hypothetical protein